MYLTVCAPSSHWFPSWLPLFKQRHRPDAVSSADPVGQLQRKNPRTWVWLHVGYSNPATTSPTTTTKITDHMITFRMWTFLDTLLHVVFVTCHTALSSAILLLLLLLSLAQFFTTLISF